MALSPTVSRNSEHVGQSADSVTVELPALSLAIILLLVQSDHWFHHPSLSGAGGRGHSVTVQSSRALFQRKPQCFRIPHTTARQASHLVLKAEIRCGAAMQGRKDTESSENTSDTGPGVHSSECKNMKNSHFFFK